MCLRDRNYIVDIKTDDNNHIYADTEYLWDKGDRIGIKIDPDKFQIVSENSVKSNLENYSDTAKNNAENDAISANTDDKGDKNV